MMLLTLVKRRYRFVLFLWELFRENYDAAYSGTPVIICVCGHKKQEHDIGVECVKCACIKFEGAEQCLAK